MLSSRVEDVRWVDSFDLPSVFDPRLPLYKEWHDFVFFDRKRDLFGLLNFAIHGNPYDASRGYGAALAFIVPPDGKVHTALELIPLGDLTVSPYNPDFVSKKVSVSYLADGSFNIKGEIEQVSLDLNLAVASPPVTMSKIAADILARNQATLGMLEAANEMAQIWDKWVELPNLDVVGTLRVDGTAYAIDTPTGYQDHEGGRFDWGSVTGWDTGVFLSDPSNVGEPGKVSFLFYRYGPDGNSQYGGLILKTADGKERYFASDIMKVADSGEFAGPRGYLPGVTRALYPDYKPRIPETIAFSAADKGDSISIVFTPRAVCTIVVAGQDEAETTFNEMYCSAALQAKVGGEEFYGNIPCWFESVRPKGRRPTKIGH